MRSDNGTQFICDTVESFISMINNISLKDTFCNSKGGWIY